ncbi:E3 ubiquitin-protein ligase UHRF1-like [Saccoglossus kowalevskii]|uniref:RING-type E3 ubiquitin transferase n=1 Tax=Saccoglossus kowalevskii TaxID=10224 RepID=A0ABM0GZQ9_SACKO|nr:PREDICTED: E3 ubiquitin-protein ligase UHRF1-like [Saccoglossus kowalevskii]
MWIQVRSMDGKKSIQVDGLSKLTKVEELRTKLENPFDAPPERQRLFYRGKQLEDGHTLFDYDVGLNEIVQIMVRQCLPLQASLPVNSANCNGYISDSSDVAMETGEAIGSDTAGPSSSHDENEENETGSIYRVGDIVDCLDIGSGAWFEAELKIITPKNSNAAKNEACEPNQETKDQTNISKDIVATNTNSSDCVDGHCDIKSLSYDKKVTERTSDEENEEPNADKKTTKADGKVKPVRNEVKPEVETEEEPDDGFIYSVTWEGYEGTNDVCSRHIRPRARTIIEWDDLKEGMTVMANYNPDVPQERGYWYDVIITNKRDTRNNKDIFGTVCLGQKGNMLHDCRILFIDEIYKIEKAGEASSNPKDFMLNEEGSPVKRQTQPECNRCKDNPRRKCKYCACHVCGGKNDPNKQLMCDECDMAYHLACLDPPLDSLPDVEEWYCPICKNDDTEVVKAGEKLKSSKKKSKMASATSTTNRDWGKGMACVGRTKVCTIVPSNHFGEIPGIHVGQLWKFRVQVSEAGVHRPHVAGIHGREHHGAYSIVLSGGYEDDQDDGDCFTYTGSGGRDLSGNKRTAEQSCDQRLTKMNMALALNCNAPAKEQGNEAKDWKSGKPVRVIRNCKGRKHSKYSPEEGNRYDGIYKVVKYWPETGKSGFLVWRYLLRRDDANPAPWTAAGKKKIKELGLKLVYPEGYLEAQKNKEEQENKGSSPNKKATKGKKRKLEESPIKTPSKKASTDSISGATKKLIVVDKVNKKLWDEAVAQVKGGKKFVEAVEEIFQCVCCQEVALDPVTTPCQHNICKSCLQRSFQAKVYNCPACRNDLEKGCTISINKELQTALRKIFPGYENGR